MRDALWKDNAPWEKYGADVCADVRMGSAETVRMSPKEAHEKMLSFYATCDEKHARLVDLIMREEGFCGVDDVSIFYTRTVEETGEPSNCPDLQNGGTWRRIGEYRACSGCGSIHPDDLASAIDKYGDAVVAGSDKGYKLYVRIPNTPNAGFGPIKAYLGHFSREQVLAYSRALEAARGIKE